ncbi:PREDICTED: c-C motif chemokine 24 [Chrysochloris asiatica]|uniref:C-C motif chemokine 24 n=1 Tax=Chrysochloris asiatica TaxID=185453 RepID=A0A9B0T752_CHRAS|nr:PREDICTED: c-C motif chemokine 24 [Chrysochloris asiatica]
MAGPATLITSLLLLALCTYHISPAGSVVIPSSCCMTFVSKQVPEGIVATYTLSSGSVCPKAGVIFTTKKGKKFCGDPKQKWVQRYMKNIDAKRKAAPGAKALRRKAAVQRHPANNITI